MTKTTFVKGLEDMCQIQAGPHGQGQNLERVAQDLEGQVYDPRSPLRAGAITRHILGVTLPSVCVRVRIYVCVCMDICIEMYIHVYLYIYIHVCIHMYTHICVNVNVYVCMLKPCEISIPLQSIENVCLVVYVSIFQIQLYMYIYICIFMYVYDQRC